MSELLSRNDLEKSVAASVALILAQYQANLDDYLDPENPNPDDVPDHYWEDLSVALIAILLPKLQAAFAQSGYALGHEVNNRYQIRVDKAVDWDLVNQAAADWAKQYTFELVKGINETSRDFLREQISNFFENQLTIGDLRNNLEAMYSPWRASLIATTEVTRANVQGELHTVNQIKEDGGPNMIPTFQTSEDDHVCPECDPLDGQVVTEDDFPPIHPSCRCWLRWTPEGWE